MKYVVVHLDNTGRGPSTGEFDDYFIVDAKDQDDALTQAARYVFATDENISDGRDLQDVIDVIKTSDILGVWAAHVAIEIKEVAL